MINAKELKKISVKESSLSKACEQMLDQGLETIAKPQALQGYRRATIGNLRNLPEKIRNQFSYDELGAMCKEYLCGLDYSVCIDSKKDIHVYW